MSDTVPTHETIACICAWLRVCPPCGVGMTEHERLMSLSAAMLCFSCGMIAGAEPPRHAEKIEAARVVLAWSRLAARAAVGVAS